MNKKLIMFGVGVITLILALAGLVLGAGLAKADPAGNGNLYYPSGSKGDQSVLAYYNDVTAVGITFTNGYASANHDGALVCSRLANGGNEAALINELVVNNSETRNQAKVAVWSAEWHFCPTYY
jgi:hypothetical protein